MSNQENTTINTTGERKITVIQPTKSLHPDQDGVKPEREKLRVAAYCRVSTLLEEQQGSYDLQQKYYETLIKGNPAWEYAGIYGDEGKSGTSLKGRTGFLHMMDDVRAGKIDYIITKATSRFGRNTSEFINILDELDSYGVEVLFESEGIMTSGMKNRTMLQIMGATNEHYSNTLSNNIRWSKERNMRKGKVTISYSHFLGYRKGSNGKPEIVEEEAEIVRLIYDLFLTGKPYRYIADCLTKQKIPTPAGKTTWRPQNIKSILTNEKYTGDVLLQKSFRRNYLDKRTHKNTGEKTQVLVENNHEAIIDKATFTKVQELVKARNHSRNSGTSTSPFVGRVICADCGDCFGHRTWNSRGRIKYSMWICNSKYTEETSYGGDKCETANLREEWLEQGYLYTMEQLLAKKRQILGKCGRRIRQIESRLSSGDIEKELAEIEDKTNEIEKQVMALEDEWAFSIGEGNNYEQRSADLKAQGEEIIRRKQELEEKRKLLNSEKKRLSDYVEAIEIIPDELKTFSSKHFLGTVDRVEVDMLTLTYHFYGGEHIKVNIDLLKKMCQ